MLLDVVVTENISLKAAHLPRLQNRAADYLSKNKIQEFKALFPNSREAPIKHKKINFCLPLSEDGGVSLSNDQCEHVLGCNPHSKEKQMKCQIKSEHEEKKDGPVDS